MTTSSRRNSFLAFPSLAVAQINIRVVSTGTAVEYVISQVNILNQSRHHIDRPTEYLFRGFVVGKTAVALHGYPDDVLLCSVGK